ncbi:MAG: SLC13/DASS family transporter [Kiritimatiellae bacterium]|nr:SLC13/DASS family transporter [Kiritimatiellia bacterium]
MTPAAITLTVFLIALGLFIADFLPMGLMVFMVPLALYFCGVIEVKEIFAPLVGQSIILVVAMSVIGAALFRTGMAERIGRLLFRFCPGERSLMMVVTLFSGVVSAFVSNTGTVAILIPIVMGAAASHRVRPSRLLIPLTAGATLGGNISVIGSPGNLIAKETIERFSEGAMSVRFFEYAGVGIPLLVAAAVFYALVGPKLLPEKGGAEAGCGGAQGVAALPGWKGWFTVAVLLGTVGAMIGADYFKWLPPMHVTACVGAVAVVLFGVLTQKEAFAAFDMQAVFLLSFMTPLGGAMMKTGAARQIADAVVGVGGGHGPLVMMAVLWLTVWGLTQVMSNTATCALFCPIGWTIAKTLGADPRAVVIAILIASSVAVCTPLAIPANSMILEPGGLRFKDFFKPGICLSALAFVLSMLLLPAIYPFYPAAAS